MNRENNTLVLNKVSQALNQILNKSNFSDSLKEYKIAEIIEVELKIIPNQTERMFEKLCGVKFYANRLSIIRLIAR